MTDTTSGTTFSPLMLVVMAWFLALLVGGLWLPGGLAVAVVAVALARQPRLVRPPDRGEWLGLLLLLAAMAAGTLALLVRALG